MPLDSATVPAAVSSFRSERNKGFGTFATGLYVGLGRRRNGISQKTCRLQAKGFTLRRMGFLTEFLGGLVGQNMGIGPNVLQEQEPNKNIGKKSVRTRRIFPARFFLILLGLWSAISSPTSIVNTLDERGGE